MIKIEACIPDTPYRLFEPPYAEASTVSLGGLRAFLAAARRPSAERERNIVVDPGITERVAETVAK